LGTEGYSPSVLRKAVRQASQAASFQEASADLSILAELTISPTHLQRLSERVGREWQQARDCEVQQYQQQELPRSYAEPPAVAVVMLDGGRYQTRADGAGRGVTDPAWKEVKVACCLTYTAAKYATDPQPEPPAKFVDRERVARLAREIQRSRGHRTGTAAGPAAPAPPQRRPRRRRRRPSRRLVRTVVATTLDNEAFGWQVAAEVHRRVLDQAKQKACLGDGSHAIWSWYEMHLLPSGFIAILDFLHLLVHLYAAAGAAAGKGSEAAWDWYLSWVKLAWAGRVVALLGELGMVQKRLGPAPESAKEDDPRRIIAETIGYVRNNRERMDYPRYRRLGLPISSAAVESTIKQINRRLKGSEKFWLSGGAEALVQVRAAYLSEDGRVDRYWERPRRSRAAGPGRLGRRAVGATQ
jgi:hypothetical protein